MFGAAIVLALIFLPGLLHSGTGGAKDAGSKAGSSIVDNVKDPQAVVDGAGTVVTPVKEAVQPWYEWFFAQPWAYAAIGAGIVAFLMRNMWRKMGPTTQTKRETRQGGGGWSFCC